MTEAGEPIGAPGLRVVAVPEQEATGFYRQRAPIAALAERGHAAEVLDEPSVSGLTWAEIGEKIEAADVAVVGSSICGRPFEARGEAFVEMRGVLVLDLDFDPWTLDKAAPEQLEALGSWVRGVDLVTAPTAELARRLLERGAPAVAVTPNAVVPRFQRTRPRRAKVEPVTQEAVTRADRLRARRHARALEAGEKSPVDKRLGWFGGDSTTAEDLNGLLRALRLVMAVDPTIGCSSLGPRDFRKQPEWARFTPPGYRKVVMDIPVSVGRTVVRAERVEAVPFNFFFPTLEGMNADLAVVPQAASPRNATKSDIAVLSWAVQGVAAVVARGEPVRELEAAGFPAIFVDNGDAAAWAAAIRGLLYDPDRRAELAHKAHGWAIRSRCFPAAAVAWERAFESACQRKGVAYSVPLLERVNGASGFQGGDAPIYDQERGP